MSSDLGQDSRSECSEPVRLADDTPPVTRHLSADQTTGHKELCRAKVARAVRAPRPAPDEGDAEARSAVDYDRSKRAAKEGV